MESLKLHVEIIKTYFHLYRGVWRSMFQGTYCTLVLQSYLHAEPLRPNFVLLCSYIFLLSSIFKHLQWGSVVQNVPVMKMNLINGHYVISELAKRLIVRSKWEWQFDCLKKLFNWVLKEET